MVRFWFYIVVGSALWGLWVAWPSAAIIIVAILLLDFTWPSDRLDDPFIKPIGRMCAIGLPTFVAIGFLALYTLKYFGVQSPDVQMHQNWLRIMIALIGSAWLFFAFRRRGRLARTQAEAARSRS